MPGTDALAVTPCGCDGRGPAGAGGPTNRGVVSTIDLMAPVESRNLSAGNGFPLASVNMSNPPPPLSLGVESEELSVVATRARRVIKPGSAQGFPSPQSSPNPAMFVGIFKPPSLSSRRPAWKCWPVLFRLRRGLLPTIGCPAYAACLRNCLRSPRRPRRVRSGFRPARNA